MSGESSEQPRKRGRPIHLPAGNQKTNKRITDRKAGQENRDIVVGLTEAAPILKELLEAFSSINEGDLLQTIRNIGDARARWNEGVQWQQDEEGNSTMPCIQEIKDAMSEAVSKVVLPLRNDLQNVMQTMPNVNLPIASQALGCQYNQNPVQSDAFAEQSPLGLPFCEEPGINIMCSTSTCDENGEKFDDEQVTIFLQEWDENKGCIWGYYRKEQLSSCSAHPTLVMFYTTIKEMDEVREVKDVNISKLRVWRDAVCNALHINMEVEFAKEHLTKIAYAYFASKTIDPIIYDQKKKLETQLGRISTMLELHDKCQSEAIFFNDKSLNTVLFP
ncbi:Putative FAM48B2 [Gossypium arboreum]|uniref:Putative FAM48B2 n=1 Tax=Gossypium arboreum TaxID=29729 RepID=A0A0B0P354_GOSAR|nr:Putative FAM48B2 [Gossypium arboreum]